MGNTPIEWTDKSWSPLRARVKADAAAIATAKGYTSLIPIATKMAGHVGPHCERVSHGCDHCYSDTNNGRCLPSNGTGLPFDRRSRDLVDTFVDEKILTQPLKWREPKRVFVENQSDLFGEWVTDEQIDRVFAIMALCPQHTFQVLTKRAERMLAYFAEREVANMPGFVYFDGSHARVFGRMVALLPTLDARYLNSTVALLDKRYPGEDGFMRRWPLPNCWLGVSVEDQATADARIPLLLQAPAAVRFVSYEPALRPVNFLSYIGHETFLCKCGWHETQMDLQPFGRDEMCLKCGQMAKRFPALDWVIIGGESGPGARPFDIAWARNTIQQCKAAGVAVFCKQLGTVPMMDENQWRARIDSEGKARLLNPLNVARIPSEFVPLAMSDRKGGDINEFPEDLRVREFPAVSR